jgi:asparagine synthase (glutamine-hydrolysing)
MCGISGIAFSDGLRIPEQSTLQAMTDIIRHRGPDGEGFFRAPGIGIGMRRLSIIDLVTGQQPIHNESRTISIVCNGEIYNYIELRKMLQQQGHHFQTHSDVEVIVHLYEDHGERCLEMLRGMFAFALWDAPQKRLLLARDRLGIKPLYWAILNDRALYFGSEIKSILASGAVVAALEPEALRNIIHFGFELTPQTLFKGISQIPPGHLLCYEKGTVTIEQYWDLVFPETAPLTTKRSLEEWSTALEAKFDETIKLHLRSDVPVSGWLSSGIDSSAVVAYMQRHANTPITTFSLKFEDDACDELSGRRILNHFPGFEFPNEQLQCSNHRLHDYPASIWHTESPDTSGINVLQMLLAQRTVQEAPVVLTGEGADEIFGGYPWYRFDKLSHPFGWIPHTVRRFLLLGSLVSRWKPWASQVFLAKRPIGLDSYAELIGAGSAVNAQELLSPSLQSALRPKPTRPAHLKTEAEIHQLHRFHRIQYVEMKTRLLDWILKDLDRASMSKSLEARVPFLDHELVELACQIPPALKMQGLKEKYIFRHAMAKQLPAEIVHRKKFGLRAPNATWLRNNLPEFVPEMFSAPQIRRTGYFNPDTVKSMLRRHRSGAGNYSRPLMLVLGVQLWHSQFIDHFHKGGLRDG